MLNLELLFFFIHSYYGPPHGGNYDQSQQQQQAPPPDQYQQNYNAQPAPAYSNNGYAQSGYSQPTTGYTQPTEYDQTQYATDYKWVEVSAHRWAMAINRSVNEIFHSHSYFFVCLISSAAYQQPQDQRYAGYTQPDYSTQQYGTTTDYNAPAADYSQTAQYDSRSYGYGE